MNLDSDSPISPLLMNQGKPNDWMNEVPDDVLSFVLSLLSIRDAAKARVLSRRWRYICPSMLHLNFDFDTVLGYNFNGHGYSDISRQDMCKFITRVDQFLELYNGQKLDSLRVYFCLGNEYASHIDGWVRSAIRMKTKRLDLDLSANRHRNNLYDFPCQLLLQAETSQLTHLCLKSCNLIMSPHLVGSSISLTKIDLEFVRLDQNSAKSILSGCLNLEWLRLKVSELPETFCIHGPALHLKTLIVNDCNRVNKIEIFSVGLTTFEYTGRITNITLVDVCHMEKVHVGFTSGYGNGTRILNGLAKDLPQLQILSLGLSTHQVPASISRFNHLKELELFYLPLDYDLLVLASLLNASPILQKFHLALLSRTARRVPRRREQQYGKQVHHRLKEVEVYGFDGRSNEVELVIYLLNNAVSLERMTLNSKRRIYNTSEYRQMSDYSWVEEERKEAYDMLQKEKFISSAKLILL